MYKNIDIKLNLIFLFVLIQIILSMLFYFIKPYNFDVYEIILYKYSEILIFILIGIFAYKLNNYIFLFLLSLIFRLLYGYVHYKFFEYFQGFPMSMGASYDEHTYYIFAKEFHNLVTNNSIYDMSKYVNFPTNYMGYPYLLSFLMHIFGVSNYYHLILNPLLMILSGFIFFKLFNDFTMLPRKLIKIWLIIFLFAPNTIYFSILNVKDSLLMFAISISFYSAFSILYKKNILIKLIFIILFFLSVYMITFVRTPFIIFPFAILLFNMRKKYILAFILFIVLSLNVFFYKAMSFFRWEYILLVFSKFKKWQIMKHNLYLIWFLFIFSPLLIILPLPIIYPLPSSIDVNLTTEIWKIPINIEYIILFLVLVNFILNKDYKGFYYLTKKISYFKLIGLIFIVLLISNYLTYERHRLLLEILLYLPVSYLIYYKRINLKIFIFFIPLIFMLILYYTYLRGILKGVF